MTKKDLRIVYLLFGLLVVIDVSFLVFLGIQAYVTTRPIEIGGSVQCNSGNIGIDYQTHFNSTYPYQNIPTVLNLKGINNLSCRLDFQTKSQISDLIYFVNAYNNQNER